MGGRLIVPVSVCFVFKITLLISVKYLDKTEYRGKTSTMKK